MDVRERLFGEAAATHYSRPLVSALAVCDSGRCQPNGGFRLENQAVAILGEGRTGGVTPTRGTYATYNALCGVLVLISMFLFLVSA
jgi:hypothetical protein